MQFASPMHEPTMGLEPAPVAVGAADVGECGLQLRDSLHDRLCCAARDPVRLLHLIPGNTAHVLEERAQLITTHL